MDQPLTKKHLAFVGRLLRPFWLSLLMMAIGAVATAVDVVIEPYLLKYIVDYIGQAEATFSIFSEPLFFYVAALFVISGTYRLCDYFSHIRMIPRLRQNLFNATLHLLLKQSIGYYQKMFVGSLVNRVTNLTSGIPELLHIAVDRFLTSLLALVFGVITLWQISPYFAFSMMTMGGVLLMGIILFSRKLMRLSAIWSETNAIAVGKMVDILSNILPVRLFNGQQREEGRFMRVTRQAQRAETHLEWAYWGMWLCCGGTFCVIQTFNVYLLIKGKREGWVTLGDYALVLTLNGGIIGCFFNLAKNFSQFAKTWGVTRQALQALLVVPEMRDAPHAKPLRMGNRGLTFDNVSFHYPEKPLLFDHLSLYIPPHQKIGLVGYSGSGKSTFVNLILRLFDVSGGRILINGQDIRFVTQASLSQAIGMIPQDPTLFHRTIKDNIRYGCPEASDEEVVMAAKGADAHAFIMDLPAGYDTLVGERGIKLSGGQRQRIAIARVILKNAPILILDEATSQLDSVTEHAIQQALAQVMQNKLTIVIAHRLSTLLHMDRLLVFDQGRIVEDGPHSVLINRDGLYKKLWTSQVGGFLPSRGPRES